MTRNVIVVDVESSGRDPQVHQCVEVAWWDLSTGQRGWFIPRHDVREMLAHAELDALRVNRYLDRIAGQPQDMDGKGVRALGEVLDGHTLAGANPRFDDGFLTQVFRAYEAMDLCGISEWHYRLWDIEAYAAGVLKLKEIPGSAEICELLGVNPGPDHTAVGDVTAEGRCLIDLMGRAGILPS